MRVVISLRGLWQKSNEALIQCQDLEKERGLKATIEGFQELNPSKGKAVKSGFLWWVRSLVMARGRNALSCWDVGQGGLGLVKVPQVPMKEEPAGNDLGS